MKLSALLTGLLLKTLTAALPPSAPSFASRGLEEPCSRGIKACSNDGKSLLICNADRKFEVFKECPACCRYGQHGYADCYIESECPNFKPLNDKRDEVPDASIDAALEAPAIAGPRPCYYAGAEQCGPDGRAVEFCTPRGFWAIKQKCALKNCCGVNKDNGRLECLCQASPNKPARQEGLANRDCKPGEVRCKGKQVIEKCQRQGIWKSEKQCTTRCIKWPSINLATCKLLPPSQADGYLEERAPVQQGNCTAGEMGHKKCGGVWAAIVCDGTNWVQYDRCQKIEHCVNRPGRDPKCEQRSKPE